VSEADVEVAKRAFALWARGEFFSPELFTDDVENAWIGSDIEWFTGEWHGREEFGQVAAAYMRDWSDVRFEPERFIDLGDRVLVLDRQFAVGRRSGIRIDHPMAHVFTIRDGKIACLHSYWHRDEAFAAVGLEGEPSASPPASPPR
jgi:ketosteroid isomerase-like protein